MKCWRYQSAYNHTAHRSTTLKRNVFPTKRTFPQENIEWLWLVWFLVGGGRGVEAVMVSQLLQNPILSRILLRIQIRRWGRTIVRCIQTFFPFLLHSLMCQRCAKGGFLSPFFLEGCPFPFPGCKSWYSCSTVLAFHCFSFQSPKDYPIYKWSPFHDITNYDQ